MLCMSDRPAIPRQMRRDALVEAGYRCAIPNCRERTVEVHHIDDWAEVQQHTFDNLIVLCANFHQLATAGKIDRKAMRQIKANLSIVTGRYGDLERRVLRLFSESPDADYIDLDSSLSILMSLLVEDQLMQQGPFQQTMNIGGHASGVIRSA
jgi:hypothetical protein